MGKPFNTNIDLLLNELQNAKFHILVSDPGSPDEALFWYNSTQHVLKYYDGTSVHAIFELSAADVLALLVTVDGSGSGLDADLLDGQHGAHYLDRANHTGTQAISTVSGLQAALDAKIDDTEKGANNGVAELDGSGHVPLAQLPDAVIGGLQYQGTWNASTNTPTITSSTGTQGHYYVVSTAGTTNIDGISDWEIGDWIVFNGSVWEKVDNSDKVSSVNGQTGVVVLDAGDIAYDNGTSGLTATDVQAAIDEVYAATGAGLGKYVENIGDGVSTQIDVVHNLGTRDVVASVKDAATPWLDTVVEWSALDVNTVRIEFPVAPATGEYRVTVIG